MTTVSQKQLNKFVWNKFKNHSLVDKWWSKYCRARRRKLWIVSEQQNHKCCYCARLTWVYDGKIQQDDKYVPDRLFGMAQKEMATIDHIIPLSKGGKDILDNIIMACERCNNIRGNRDAYEFWSIMQKTHTRKTFIMKQKSMQKVKKIIKESNEKRKNKQNQISFWLAYICYISPELNCIFEDVQKAFQIEINKRIEDAQYKINLYSDLVDSELVIQVNQLAGCFL